MQFITDFMVRAAFANTYNSPNTPAGNTAYVDALLNTAGDFFYSFALTLTNFVTGMTRVVRSSMALWRRLLFWGTWDI